MVLVRVRFESLHSKYLLCDGWAFSDATLLYVQSDKYFKAVIDCLLECAATRGTAVASSLTPTSQQTLPQTSPPRLAQRTSRSALRTSPRTETTHPSEGEQTVNMERLPELLAKATATPGSVSSTLAGLGKKLSHPFLSCPVLPSCSLLAHLNKWNPFFFPLFTNLFLLQFPLNKTSTRTSMGSIGQAKCHWHMFFWHSFVSFFKILK